MATLSATRAAIVWTRPTWASWIPTSFDVEWRAGTGTWTRLLSDTNVFTAGVPRTATSMRVRPTVHWGDAAWRVVAIPVGPTIANKIAAINEGDTHRYNVDNAANAIGVLSWSASPGAIAIIAGSSPSANYAAPQVAANTQGTVSLLDGTTVVDTDTFTIVDQVTPPGPGPGLSAASGGVDIDSVSGALENSSFTFGGSIRGRPWDTADWAMAVGETSNVSASGSGSGSVTPDSPSFSMNITIGEAGTPPPATQFRVNATATVRGPAPGHSPAHPGVARRRQSWGLARGGRAEASAAHPVAALACHGHA